MKTPGDKNSKTGKKEFPGYPQYPSGEDIYNQDNEEQDLDPENPNHIKSAGAIKEKLNEKNFRQDMSGGDLDVPGVEMDDEQENIGSEDEENNLYSLGGDKEG